MSTQAERIITLYAQKGGKKAKLTTDVSIWSELKALVKKEGYEIDKLHATENFTKTDLVNDNAALPVGDFTLFMRPKQVKSGAGRGDGLSYKEIKAAIKADLDTYSDAAKAHYNEDKNYTVKPTEELRSLLSSFVAPSSAPVAKEKKAKEVVAETAATEVIAEITNLDRVNQIGVLLSEINVAAGSQDVVDRVSEIIEDILPGLKAEIEADTNVKTTNVADVVKSVAVAKEEPKETAEEIAAREAKVKADEEENKRLAAEAKEFS